MSNASTIDGEIQALEQDPGVEDEQVDDNLELTHPFDPNKIRVTTEPKTIDLLFRRINHGEIDLAPDFQRRAPSLEAAPKGATH